MKTLLVLAEHPGAAEAVRAGTIQDRWRVVHRTALADAEPMLVHGLVHACLLDLSSADVQSVWSIEKIRKWSPGCPIILAAMDPKPEWVEDAYLAGASHVIGKPIRARLLAEILNRLSAPGAEEGLQPLAPESEPSAAPDAGARHNLQGLATLRGFSGILTHSLDEPALLQQFLLYIREMFGLNRAAIFLTTPGQRQLRLASAIGVPKHLLQSVELSLDSGVAQAACGTARIVRRRQAAAAARKELETLGTEVAIPILNREEAIGVALLDARITGESLSNPELEMLFHLLEQLGMGLRNISLHEQVASNSQILAGVLRELSSGCVVIDRNLKFLHANKAARKFFFPAREARARDFEFSDLPEEIGGKVYQVLQTGTAVLNHRYEAGSPAGAVYTITVAPFRLASSGAVESVLLMAEDLTQAEQMRKLEVEAADAQLMRKMADRMSAEIGNAIMPVSTYQQLFTERWKDAEFRASMNEELSRAVGRIERLLKQMRYLAGQNRAGEESFPLGSVLEESYQEACKYQTVKPVKLKVETRDEPVSMTGDRAALKYAFTEIMLNALLASPGEQGVAVRAAREAAPTPMVRIEIQDRGEGFTPEAAMHATDPFFATKPVGVGLGLTVARRIIEAHRGKIEIPTLGNGQSGLVRVFLPAEKAPKRA